VGTPLYTDVRLYVERGIPGVIYGAGPRTVLESHAKRADERLVLEDLRRATKVVARSWWTCWPERLPTPTEPGLGRVFLARPDLSGSGPAVHFTVQKCFCTTKMHCTVFAATRTNQGQIPSQTAPNPDKHGAETGTHFVYTFCMDRCAQSSVHTAHAPYR
jgi:hypothetical protein